MKKSVFFIFLGFLVFLSVYPVHPGITVDADAVSQENQPAITVTTTEDHVPGSIGAL